MVRWGIFWGTGCLNFKFGRGKWLFDEVGCRRVCKFLLRQAMGKFVEESWLGKLWL